MGSAFSSFKQDVERSISCCVSFICHRCFTGVEVMQSETEIERLVL